MPLPTALACTAVVVACPVPRYNLNIILKLYPQFHIQNKTLLTLGTRVCIDGSGTMLPPIVFITILLVLLTETVGLLLLLLLLVRGRPSGTFCGLITTLLPPPLLLPVLGNTRTYCTPLLPGSWMACSPLGVLIDVVASVGAELLGDNLIIFLVATTICLPVGPSSSILPAGSAPAAVVVPPAPVVPVGVPAVPPLVVAVVVTDNMLLLVVVAVVVVVVLLPVLLMTGRIDAPDGSCFNGPFMIT